MDCGQSCPWYLPLAEPDPTANFLPLQCIYQNKIHLRFYNCSAKKSQKYSKKYLLFFFAKMLFWTTHKLPKPICTHNESIMDAIIKQTPYMTKDLVSINKCRMYLQVISLVDITKGDRKQITGKIIPWN